MSFEAVIGLEIHAQLATATKIFCGCSTAFGAPPNTHVCPVCLGFPGVLPVLNRAAVEHAVTAALALGCEIQRESIFARKNYFYPDLPKGYQISQYERPLALNGHVRWRQGTEMIEVGIHRVHMEEDAGKSLHEGFPDSDRATYVDCNRAGVPLVEIVTHPDLRSAEAAAGFFAHLRELLVALGVNDGNLEEGSLRCDANVSVRQAGASELGVKTEIKNLNSFRFLQKAIEHEIGRQVEVLTSGGRVRQETRLWDSASGRTEAMRSKEEAHDYRYFPEPDLPPLRVDAADVDRLRAALPELPETRRDRFVTQYGLPPYDAGVLTQSHALADYFEQTAAAAGNAKAASNWVMGELLRLMNAAGLQPSGLAVRPGALAGLIKLVDAGTINVPTAKAVFEKMFATGRPADDIVKAEGLAQIDDEGALVEIVRTVLAENADAVEQVRKGKQAAVGFLVGQVMRAARGKANPKLANALLTKELAK
jgi:aspartyl-tRNA(Asn)/glutamyl-tRNA(Gln) amidotransferase subunit B